jgi:hypothetical protein
MANTFSTSTAASSSLPASVTESSRIIGMVSEAHLRQLATSNPQTGTPQYAATRPVASDGSGRQQWEVVFYPTPNEERTLEYRYSLIPETLSTAKPYPLGGRQYAELLLQSCLAVLEQREKKAEGVATARYIERLAAAIQLDVQVVQSGELWPVGSDPVDLSIDRDYLERLVGRHMGFGPSPDLWTHKARGEVNEAVRSGLRRFYTPPVLPGERWAHMWSFLRPLASVNVVAGVSEYDLPDDFAMLDGPLTYGIDAYTLCGFDVPLMSEYHVRRILSLEYEGRPEAAAIRVKQSSDGQTRWQLVVAPVPNAAYELQYRYQTNPGLLASGSSVPPGGQPHAQTIIESCLWAADVLMGAKSSLHALAYMDCLRSSVSHDRVMNAPDTLGRNIDRSDGVFGDNYRGDLHIVTYNGVEVS